MSVTFEATLIGAADASGVPISNGTAVMVIDLDGDGWNGTDYLAQSTGADNASAWLWDADDLLLKRERIGELAPGLTQPFAELLNLPPGFDANVDRWYVLWFDTPFDADATGPGVGVAYGVVDAGSVPSDGSTLTPFLNGAAANLVTVGEDEATATIGGLVFDDANRDGIRDGGEAGVAAVRVDLLNAADQQVATTTTGVDGTYQFSDVAPGDYKVRFVAPIGKAFTLRDQGGDDALDSDPDPSTGVTALFTVVGDEVLTNVDAGLVTVETVGDLVFDDLDRDGVQDAGEPGVPGVQVELLDADDQVLLTTNTDAQGRYLFSNLGPGTYKVRFVAPPGETFTLAGQGGDGALDSDADPVTGVTAAFTLTQGQQRTDLDAGLVSVSSVGDFVFDDANENGIQDVGELGIAGVQVDLLNAAEQLLATTTTNASGLYSFAGLAPGNYKIRFHAPPGKGFTLKDQGGLDALDSDADAGTGVTDLFLLGDAENRADIDAGLIDVEIPLGSIGDLVFDDANGNGIQDGGEQGVAGVQVDLLNAADVQVATTTTDVNGQYSFTDVAPGSYKVRFIAPAGKLFALMNQGSDDALDSDADPSTGMTGLFTVGAGEMLRSIDAGLVDEASLLSSIGNFVFDDTNGNGIQDEGEAGIAGVQVELLGVGDQVLDTTITSAGGMYGFTGLEAGDYKVRFIAPPGKLFTLMDQGDDDTLDSDADVSTGATSLFTLAAGQNLTSIDAGLIDEPVLVDLTVAIAGSSLPVNVTAGSNTTLNVTVDITNAGPSHALGEIALQLSASPDGDPANLANVVLLTQTGVAVDLAANGSLQRSLDFTIPASLAAGSYRFIVSVDTNDQVEETDETNNAVVTPGSVQVQEGAPVTGLISGTKFNDLDGDGVQDAGETGLAGWTIFLDADNDGVLDAGEISTVTASDGTFTFGNLAAGQYHLAEVQQSGWTQTGPAGGTHTVNLVAGQTIVGLLFANRLTPPAPGSISGQKFHDLNADGTKESGEPGLQNWVIYIDANANGTLDAGELAVATDATGNYTLPNLQPGTYTVAEQLLTGWMQSTPGGTHTVVVSAGQSVTGINFGNYRTGSISGAKFNDLDGNGVQTSGEVGLANWTIFLDADNNGQLDAGEPSTVTDALGTYSFSDLAPGAYTVREVQQEGWTQSGPTGGAHQVVVTSGQTVTGLLFANQLIPVNQASISGLKFNDQNGNGVRDTGEPGLANWTVFLDTDGDGVLDPGEASTLTNSQGNYTFTGLLAGTYRVAEVVQDGWTQTAPAGGTHTIVVAQNTAVTAINFGNQVTPEVHHFDHDTRLDFQGVRYTLRGAGTGSVIVANDGVHLRFEDTDQKTRVTVKGPNVNFRSIQSDSAMDRLNLRDQDVLGDLTFGGPIRLLRLRNFSAADQVLTVTGVDPRSALTLQAETVMNVSVVSGIPIKKIDVQNWLDTAGAADLITAPFLEHVKADRFEADMLLTDGFARWSLKSLNVNELTNARIVTMSSVDRIRAKFIHHSQILVGVSGDVQGMADSAEDFTNPGAVLEEVRATGAPMSITDSTIIAALIEKVHGKDIVNTTIQSGGDTGLIQANSLTGSRVLVGGAAAAGLPNSAGAFFNRNAMLHRLKLSGRGVNFADTSVIAAHIDDVRLGNVQIDNEATLHGVVAQTIEGLKFRSPADLPVSPEDLLDDDYLEGDFIVRLV